jgi:hypothetical protein
MHYRLAVALTKCAVEAVAVMLGEVIPRKGLAAIFVDTLEDLLRLDARSGPCRVLVYLVRSRVSQTREQGEETASDGRVCLVPEDDLVQLRGRCNLGTMVVSRALKVRMRGAVPCPGCSSIALRWCRRDGKSSARRYRRFLHRLDSSKSVAMMPLDIPAPRKRAAVDSFLNSFADDLVPAAALATFAAASDADGTVISAIRLGSGGQIKSERIARNDSESSGWRDKIFTIQRRQKRCDG